MSFRQHNRIKHSVLSKWIIGRISSSIILIVLIFMGKTMQAQYTKTDSVNLNSSTIFGSGSGTLYVRSFPAVASPCGFSVQNSSIYVCLNTGNPYTFGNAVFNANVNLTIAGYSTFTGSSGLVVSWTTNLLVNDTVPLNTFKKDFTAIYSTVNRWVLTINSVTFKGGVSEKNSLNAAFYFTEHDGIDVSGVTVGNKNPSGTNPVTFQWSTTCGSVPEYELQVLRLFNTDSTNAWTNEMHVKATIDWTQALDMITGNSDSSFSLTLAEGQGYYLWRVRPIGTKYPGEFADSRNYGTWSTGSSYSQGSTVNLTAAVLPYIFFYYQFNDTVNWIYNRTFSEGDMASSKTRVSEGMTFANQLLQPKQEQVHIMSHHNVLVQQSVYDYSGRAAIQTLPAPISVDTLGYSKAFILGAVGTTYNASFFDANNYESPAPVVAGSLYNYYSNSNSNIYVPGAEGYPYSREIYERNGTGRLREQAGPGGTYHVQQVNSRTTKTYYGGVADIELIRMFGDEAPKDTTVYKEVQVDGNNTATVSYIDKEGKTIATCLSVGIDSAGGILDPLSEQATGRFSVKDTLHNHLGSNEQLLATKSLALTAPTNVSFKYVIHPGEISNACPAMCNRCDYQVVFAVTSDTSTVSSINHIIGGDTCSHATSWDTSFTLTLQPGQYQVEKILQANVVDPASQIDTMAGSTYEQVEEDTLTARYNRTAYAYLDSVTYYLQHSQMSKLYAYLHVNISVNNPDSVFADSSVVFNIGCSSIRIPILVCPENSCTGNPDFEGYFKKQWADSSQFWGTTGGYLNYLNVFPDNYKPGQFNYLIKNMLADGYTCDNLWNCWKSLTAEYATLKNENISGFNFDMVRSFLDCTGRKYKGSYNSVNDTSAYRSHAYEYFYNKYDINEGDTLCYHMMKTIYGDTNTWGQDTLTGQIKYKKWQQFYDCIWFTDTNAVANNNDTTTDIATAECTCISVCEARYSGFVDAIIRMYHNDSIYVQGDKYYLQKDTFNDGNIYIPGLTKLPNGFSNYKTMTNIECAARDLVTYCEGLCTDQTIYRNNGHMDSVGNPSQHNEMEEAMTDAYTLSLAPCGGGSVKIAPMPSTTKIFDRDYGSPDTDQLWDITKDTACYGSYVLAGWIKAGKGSVTDTSIKDTVSYWAVKVNQGGAKEWDKVYSGDRKDYLRSVVQMPDGGYMLGGYSNSGKKNNKSHASYGGYDYWVVKIDANGTEVWDSTYGSNKDDILQSIHRTRDNKYLLVGYTYGIGASGNKTSSDSGVAYWVVKIDSSGRKLWDKSYQPFGTQFTSRDTSIGEVAVETKNGNYIFGGYSNMQVAAIGKIYAPGYGKYDYWIMETDQAGDTIKSRYYGGKGNDYLYDISPYVSDTSFLLVGTSDSSSSVYTHPRVLGDTNQRLANTHGQTDVWVVKIDSTTLNRKWDSAYGGKDKEATLRPARTVRIKATIDTNFVIGAISKSNAGGDKSQAAYGAYDYWTFKINPTGTRLWDWTFGAPSNDIATAVDQDKDGFYWIAGFSYSDSNTVNGDKTQPLVGGTKSDYWIIKAQESCTHDTICLTWQSPTARNNNDTIPFYYISCDSNNAGQVYQSIVQQVSNKIDSAVANYNTNYITSCEGLKNVLDTFTMSYTLTNYHYTLYFYDRADNLTKTVPPKGIDLTCTNRLQHPNDSLASFYWYNSIGQLIKDQIPDNGINYYYYDYYGQLRYTQNSKQRQAGAFSYTKYDGLGRIIEMGQSTDSTSFVINKVNHENFPLTNNSQRTYTTYTVPGPETGIHNDGQTFLRNRVSFTSNDDSVYTYYSYDQDGNVKWQLQNLPGDQWKEYVNYNYNTLNQKVVDIKYDSGADEAYYHKYYYDADQRFSISQSTREMEPSGEDSHNLNVGWDADAYYNYYDHSPLKRVAFGQDSVQGMDYVFTLFGLIKGINYPTLTPSADPGGDGGIGRTMPKDLVGMTLGYDNDDFNRSSSEFLSTNSNLISSNGATSFLNNGNISSLTENIKAVGGGNKYEELNGYQYRYDQLNRIKKGAFRYNNGSWTMATDSDYLTKFTYDPNGNLNTLSRNAYDNPSPYSAMDYLTYKINKGTNQLNYVTDSVRAGKWSQDIDNESANNYSYDSIGELTKDVAGGISSISWTVYGQIQSIKKTNGDSLHYVYNAMQDRVEKVYIPNGGSRIVTYYVRDAEGNILSTYYRTEDANYFYYYQTEVPIYGNMKLGEYVTNTWVKTVKKNNYNVGPFYYPGWASDRTANLVTNTQTINKHVQINGTWKTVAVTARFNPASSYTIYIPNSIGHFYRKVNQKEYQIDDQIDNVDITVSDRKDSLNNAIMLEYNNYYSFGMIEPSRTYNAGSYRFAFNGMESDNEIYGTDNSYTTDNREYDPRLGRWMTVDPLQGMQADESPYDFANNSPIALNDETGLNVWEWFKNLFKKNFSKKRYRKIGRYSGSNNSHHSIGKFAMEVGGLYRHLIKGAHGVRRLVPLLEGKKTGWIDVSHGTIKRGETKYVNLEGSVLKNSDDHLVNVRVTGNRTDDPNIAGLLLSGLTSLTRNRRPTYIPMLLAIGGPWDDFKDESSDGNTVITRTDFSAQSGLVPMLDIASKVGKIYGYLNYIFAITKGDFNAGRRDMLGISLFNLEPALNDHLNPIFYSTSQLKLQSFNFLYPSTPYTIQVKARRYQVVPFRRHSRAFQRLHKY